MTGSLAEFGYRNNLTVPFWYAKRAYQAIHKQGHFPTKLTFYSGETYQKGMIRYKKCELEVHGVFTNSDRQGFHERMGSSQIDRVWGRFDFCYTEVQFKKFSPPVETSRPPAEIVNESS